MNRSNEKRCESRYPCDAAMEWTYFNREERFECRVLNVSEGGGYFECGLESRPGATIRMQLKKCNLGSGKCGNRQRLRRSALAKVEWCRRITSARDSRYGVGVQYFLHY